MNDSWCKRLFYRNKILTGGAARNVRISKSGGMDEIIKDIATQVWNAATFAANKDEGGKVFQMPAKQKIAS